MVRLYSGVIHHVKKFRLFLEGKGEPLEGCKQGRAMIRFLCQRDLYSNNTEICWTGSRKWTERLGGPCNDPRGTGGGVGPGEPVEVLA